jgi:hypothetical protein
MLSAELSGNEMKKVPDFGRTMIRLRRGMTCLVLRQREAFGHLKASAHKWLLRSSAECFYCGSNALGFARTSPFPP